jgi:hypothetical protein
LPSETWGRQKPADLTAVTDSLAKLLGKKKLSFKQLWYDGLESYLWPAPRGRVQ